MTPAEGATLIKRRCGGRSDTDIDTYILDEMNAALIELESGPFWPWFLLDQTAIDVANPDTYHEHVEDADYPLAMYENYCPRFLSAADADPVFLKQRPREELDRYAETTGDPKYFAWEGNRLYWFPPGQASGNIYYKVFKRSVPFSALTQTTNLPKWCFHAPLVLFNLAGAHVAGQILRDQEAERKFLDAYNFNLSNLRATHTAWEVAQMNLDAVAMGEW